MTTDQKLFLFFARMAIRVALFGMGASVWVAFEGMYLAAALFFIVMASTVMALWRYAVNHEINLFAGRRW